MGVYRPIHGWHEGKVLLLQNIQTFDGHNMGFEEE